MVFPVAEALQASEVPFVFATRYDSGVIPRAFSNPLVAQKPINGSEVMRVLLR